jgi:hypothetical protein
MPWGHHGLGLINVTNNTKQTNKQRVCVLHCGIPIYIKKYLKAKEEL